MDMTQNKCCRHGTNLRRRRRRRRKIRHSVIFLCSSIAVIVFVAVESRMIRSGDGRTNKYDVEAGNNTYDNAVIENSKISEKNKIQNNQSMLDDIMNSTQYPKQLKDLALKNEEALEFVYDYPAEHVKEHTIDLTEEASMDSVPLFVQWDKRWGYEKYSGNFFAASGCGPTTLSMVVVYLTHNRDASPIAVAKYSKEAGYSVDGSGSSWTIISEGCRHYGVKAKTVALDESRMKALFLDPGLLLAVLKLDGYLSQQMIELIMTGSPHELVNKGGLSEMVAGLEIMRNKPCIQRQKLFYWEKKGNSVAEIDYVDIHNLKVTPIEIKSGTQGGMKSLWLFMREKHLTEAIRCSLENFGEFTYIDQADQQAIRHVKICPLYALKQIWD